MENIFSCLFAILDSIPLSGFESTRSFRIVHIFFLNYIFEFWCRLFRDVFWESRFLTKPPQLNWLRPKLHAFSFQQQIKSKGRQYITSPTIAFAGGKTDRRIWGSRGVYSRVFLLTTFQITFYKFICWFSMYFQERYRQSLTSLLDNNNSLLFQFLWNRQNFIFFTCSWMWFGQFW